MTEREVVARALYEIRSKQDLEDYRRDDPDWEFAAWDSEYVTEQMRDVWRADADAVLAAIAPARALSAAERAALRRVVDGFVLLMTEHGIDPNAYLGLPKDIETVRALAGDRP